MGQRVASAQITVAAIRDGAGYTNNLLLNSDFATEKEHWFFYTNAALDASMAREGRGTVKLESAGLTEHKYAGLTQTSTNGNPNLLIEGGKTITASLWSYTDDLSTFEQYGASFEVDCYDADDKRLAVISWGCNPAKENEWQRFTGTRVLPEGTARVRCYIYLSRNGRIWINSPKFELGDNPDPQWSPAASELPGKDGKDGTSVAITSTEVRYSTNHASAVQPAESTFTLTAVPTLTAGQYLWSRTVVTYNNGQSTRTYGVSRVGENGQDGANYTPNLLLKGNTEKALAEYCFGQYSYDSVPVEGKEYTLTVCYKVGEKDTAIGAYWEGGWQPLPYFGSKTETVESKKVVCPSGLDEHGVPKLSFFHAPKDSDYDTDTYVKWAVLTEGDTPQTAWIPAASEMAAPVIESQSVRYAKSTTAVQPADGAFTATSVGALNLAPGEYMWSKTEVAYSDGTVTKSYAVSRVGSDGETGTPGSAGADGKSTYFHQAYANSADGTAGFSTTYFKDALYMGTCSDYTAADPTTPASYEWARLRGEDGVSAKSVIVTGEQVFVYTDDFATLVGPQNITLTATLQGTTGYAWSYSRDGGNTWTAFASPNGQTVTFGPSGGVFSSGNRSAIVRCASGGVWDEITVVKVSSGSNGEDGSNYTENLLVDSTFPDLAKWSPNANVGIDNTHTIDGRNSVKSSQSGLTTAGYRVIQQYYTKDVKPGDMFTASIWVYAEDISEHVPNDAYIELWAYNANGGRISTKRVGIFPTVAGEWQQFHVTHTMPENTTQTNVYVFVTKNGTLWFSSPKLERGANDSPVWTPNAADGDAYTVVLTNESHTFEGDTQKAVAATTECGVIAYKGATRVAATIGTVTGAPAGMTATIQSNNSTGAKFTVAVTTALTAKQGTLNVPVTVDRKQFTKVMSWSLSLQGRGISGTTEWYAVGASSTTPPADSAFVQSPVPQTTETNRYLWNYERTTYTDNTFSSTQKHVISVHGANGKPGAGITGVVNYLLASDKAHGVTTAEPGWTTDASSTAATVSAAKPYLWNYERVTYTEGNPTDTAPHVVGHWGSDGSSYNNNLLLNSNFSKDKKYWTIENGSASVVTDAARGTVLSWTPSNSRIYQLRDNIWPNTGIYTYSFMAKSDTAGVELKASRALKDLGKMHALTTEWQKYTGQIDATDTSGSLTIQWVGGSVGTVYLTDIKLEEGANENPQWTPAAGEMVAPRITEEYYLSTSATALTGGSWQPSKPAWVEGRYYWTRSKITYGTGEVEYTDAICVTGQSGTSVLAQYSVDGSTWHATYAPGDTWMRTSRDNGATWTPGIRIVGQDGASYSENLLLNSRFEDGLDKWSNWGTPDKREVVESSGKKWVHVVANTEIYQGVWQLVAGKPNTKYTLSAFARGASANQAFGFVVHSLDDNSVNLGGSRKDAQIGTAGELVVLHFTTPSNIGRLRIFVGRNTAEVSDIYFTDIKLEEGDNPNPQWTPNSSEMIGTDGAPGTPGRDGSYTVWQWALGSLTAPKETWSDTPLTAKAGEYVWMRSGTVTPPGTVPEWMPGYMRITGDSGQDGESTYLMDLSNEVVAIPCDAQGMPVTGGPWTSQIKVYKGGSQDSGWTYSAVTQGCTLDSGDYFLQQQGAVYVSAMTADTATVTVTATKAGCPTLTAVMTLYKVIPGRDGSAAKSVTVNADAQVFTYSNDFATATGVSKIYVNATLQGTTGYQWSYRNADMSDFANITGATTATYMITRDLPLWGSGRTLTLRCTSGGVHDEVTIAKVSSGANGANGVPGADAYTVILSNESHTFAGGTTAALGSTTMCDVIAYKGAAQVAATIETITGAPAGMVTRILTNGTAPAQFEVGVTTALTTTQGVLKVPVTVDGKTFTKEFSWSLALKGSTGAAGAAAVVYSILTSADTVTRNPDGSLTETTVTCTKYKTTGAGAMTATTEKYLYAQVNTREASGSWQLVAGSGQTSGSVNITGKATAVVWELRSSTATSGYTVLDRERVAVLTDGGEIEATGENLLLNSDFADCNPKGTADGEKAAYWMVQFANARVNTDTAMLHEGKNSIYLPASYPDYQFLYQRKAQNSALGAIEGGRYMTWSAWVYVKQLGASGSMTVNMKSVLADGTETHDYRTWLPTAAGRWERVEHTRLMPEGTVETEWSVSSTYGADVWIAQPKLEYGERATGWCRSERDFDAIKAALQNKGTTEGGLILGSMIRLGYNTAGGYRTMAGVNGVYNDGAPGGGLAIFAGGDIKDAALPQNAGAEDRARAALRHDGSAYFADNTLRLSENHVEVGDYLHLQDDGMHMVIDDAEKLYIGNRSVVEDDLNALSATRYVVDYQQTFLLATWDTSPYPQLLWQGYTQDPPEDYVGIVPYKNTISDTTAKTAPLFLKKGSSMTLSFTAGGMIYPGISGVDTVGCRCTVAVGYVSYASATGTFDPDRVVIKARVTGDAVLYSGRIKKMDFRGPAVTMEIPENGYYLPVVSIVNIYNAVTENDMVEENGITELGIAVKGEIAVGLGTKTLLGSDGFVSQWGSSSALYIAENGFLATVGGHGIKITGSGVYINRKDGKGYVAL